MCCDKDLYELRYVQQLINSKNECYNIHRNTIEQKQTEEYMKNGDKTILSLSLLISIIESIKNPDYLNDLIEIINIKKETDFLKEKEFKLKEKLQIR